MRVTIYANGQIMLPIKIRHRLDIKPGDSLAFFSNENNGINEIIMCKTTSVQAVLNTRSATIRKDKDEEKTKELV